VTLASSRRCIVTLASSRRSEEFHHMLTQVACGNNVSNQTQLPAENASSAINPIVVHARFERVA
jgi:hypothetical protein